VSRSERHHSYTSRLTFSRTSRAACSAGEAQVENCSVFSSCDYRVAIRVGRNTAVRYLCKFVMASMMTTRRKLLCAHYIKFFHNNYLYFFIRFISSWLPNIRNILKFTNMFQFSLKLRLKQQTTFCA
jgi:hypothetical protein